MKRTCWKKLFTSFVISLTIASGIQITAYAGQWRSDAYGWGYQENNGSYPRNQWRQLDNTWYYFDGNGYMVTGWQLINGEWYFFYDDGYMAANEWIGDYYLTGSGAMATNCSIDGYWVGSDGRYIKTQKPAQNTGGSIEVDKNTQPIQNDTSVTSSGVVNIQSNLRIENPSLPENLKQGQSFGLYGIVHSNYNITKVTGYILDSNHNEVMSKTDYPNTKSYDLNGVRNQGPINVALCFNQLSPGKYYYVLEAQDEQIGTVLINHEFNIQGNAVPSNLRIENPSLPENLKPGQSFGLYGIVLSNYNIQKVTGYILDSNHNEIMSKTDYPNAKSYDLNGVRNQGPINVALCFNQLSPGKYYYMLEAQDEQTDMVLINHEFYIKGDESGIRIVTDVANRVTCAYDGYEGHRGTDIGWRADESQNIIYPHSPGNVVAVEKNWTSAMGYNNMASYGNYVVVQHSDNYWTRYAHLDSVNVSIGQEVTFGTQLGVMGATGNVTGRHVHVELITNLRNNTRIDIGPYLNSSLPE